MEFDDTPEALALAEGYSKLDRPLDVEPLLAKVRARLDRAPGDGWARAHLVRALRRSGRCDAALEQLVAFDRVFDRAPARIQPALVFEADQLGDEARWERWISLAAANPETRTSMLPWLAKVAALHDNRPLAAALYDADERANWARKFSGKRVLLSFPKSGTTWLRFGLAEYLRLALPSPPPDSTGNVNRLLSAHGAPESFAISHDCGALCNEAGDRFDEHRVFLDTHRVRYASARVILLVRDPRDVVVSHFHQVTKRTARPMAFESIEDFVAHPTHGVARVLAFYKLIEPLAGLPDVLTVHYEDLVTDFRARLEDVVRFLDYGARGTARELDAATESARFDAMRSLEASRSIRGIRLLGETRDHFKVRRGCPGGFVDEISAEAMRDAILKCRLRPDALLDRYDLP